MTHKQNQNIACIFPAFGTKYLSNEIEILKEFSNDLDSLCSFAEKNFDFNRTLLYKQRDGLFQDELTSQLAAYIYSCSVSNLIKRKNIQSNYTAGYSMGLYATVYHNESITFPDGLYLIKKAYNFIHDASKDLNFGMGIIVGLSRDDICNIFKKVSHDMEIINTNNNHSQVISGLRADVDKCIPMAKEEGAINARILPMGSPYHSKYMDKAAIDFNEFLKNIEIKDPIFKIISTIDQRTINNKYEIRKDLVNNINMNINWKLTMEEMIKRGINTFIECGPGKSLLKIGKFIDGDFEIYPLNNLNKVL